MLGSLRRFIDVKIGRAMRTAPKSLPILLLWITDTCNLRCRMCGDRWRAHVSKEKPLLSTDEWLSVIDSAQRLNTMIVSLTGGEPLLHPDLFYILDYIRKTPIASHICTNGALLTESNVAKLAKTEVGSISVSLDSNEPSTHNSLRGRDCFNEVVTGIRCLRKRMPGTKININFLVCRLNFRKMAHMVRFGKELGVDQVNFAPIHTNLQHKYKPESDFRDLIFEKEDIPALSEELAKLRAAARTVGMRISSSSFLDGIPRFYAESSRWHTCFAGYVCCGVSPWGDVSPCADLDSKENVRHNPLHMIWRSNSFQQLRGKIDICNRQCWDTTHSELAIRCTLCGILRELPSVLKDLAVYGGNTK